MNRSFNRHLSESEIVKTGSIYTSPEIVDLEFSLVESFISEDSVIADFGAGYGAFLQEFQSNSRFKRFIATEIDPNSCSVLLKDFQDVEVYQENSLINAKREKYNLSNEDGLIAIGNPPYNDITSHYKKGQKGSIEVDPSLRSRDLGVSFLKLYNKLEAEIVCVLHPLAYLIKKSNFTSLKDFKNNYSLIKATVFSSKEFVGIKNNRAEFPVVAALYKRNKKGMTYEEIQNFEFSIYNSKIKFKLNNIPTIDGQVQKYPKKGHHDGLQFYTLRDMNALSRNATFVENRTTNAIEVNDNNLYQYSWLLFLKENFKPKKNKFLYGNLSPLYSKKISDKEFKREVVSYAFNNNSLVSRYYDKPTIEGLYGTVTNQYEYIYQEIEIINSYFV